MPRQYLPQFRERALRLVEETLPNYETDFVAMKKVAGITRDGESSGFFCRLHACDISGWDAKSPA
mgnify:CR=1 FL=1